MNLNDIARFFIIYPLNLEDLGLLELERLMALYFSDVSYKVLEKVPGGLLLECPLKTGFILNHLLRTPTRILLRLGEFKCRDAPKLFNKMSKFNWSFWLIGQIPEVESASLNSRLFDSRKIEKAIADGIKDYYRHRPVKKKYLEHLSAHPEAALPRLYFRADNDLCTISLDTTGERLHLRGEKILSANAPIRENLAALLLLELKQHLPCDQKEMTLIDPMCGSGTFLMEERSLFKITLNRDFSYQHLPVVLDDPQFLKNIPPEGPTNDIELIGMDQDELVIKQAKENVKDKNITLFKADLFSNGPELKTQKNKVVIINPPYGIRVGQKEEIDTAYYLRIIDQIKKKFNPALLGIIVPSDYKIKAKSGFQILSTRAFKNGGIEVRFYVLAFK